MIFLYFLFCMFNCFAVEDFSPLENVPTAYNGRFRPADVAAKAWLNENLPYADTWKLLWKMHFLGHKQWDDETLFEIRNEELRKLISLPRNPSFTLLKLTLLNDQESNLKLITYVLPYFYLKKYSDVQNRKNVQKLELTPWFPGLWLTSNEKYFEVLDVPKRDLFKHLNVGTKIPNEKNILRKRKKLAEDFLKLFSQFQNYQRFTTEKETQFENAYLELKGKHLQPKEIALSLENQFPFFERLENVGNDFKMLPGRNSGGTWYSLRALKSKVYDPDKNRLLYSGNFTLYTDKQFELIRTLYFELDKAMHQHDEVVSDKLTAQLSYALIDAYQKLSGEKYIVSQNKSLNYPTMTQLRVEGIYYRLPFNFFIFIGYGLVIAFFVISYSKISVLWPKAAFYTLVLTFFLHTILLLMRCFVLTRPPVSNMSETMIYVPWIAVCSSLLLSCFFRQKILLFASAIAAFILFGLFNVMADDSMENVQAVLDSQYWLTIHVLMVVGSYGIFILGSILGHIYLFQYLNNHENTTISKCILQAYYVGTFMLISGTILGGVWAAESWGRFWDWDPKEAWAFISSCIYLIWIHAYRFNHISNLGLAIGSIVGVMAISFTWYGVNYILGTGLHSYGFGSGGEEYYYIYLIIELLLLGFVEYKYQKKMPKELNFS